jgi:hypothetical protein
MAGLNFNAQEHDTTQSSTLPLGDYELEVVESEVKPTSKGTGHILRLVEEVREPEEFKGRKLFHNINIANDNPVAEKIGKEDLAKLCRAIGISHVDDSDELHYKPFRAKVGLEKPQPGYDPRNKIVRYYFPDEGEVPEAKVAPANDNRASANDNAPAAAGGAKKSRPWGK